MNRFSYWQTALPAALLAVGLTTGAVAKQDVNRPAATTSGSSGRVSASLCLVSSSRAELDINNVRAMVLNGGDMWWDLNNPRYEVPKVTEANRPRRHSIFAGALWLGGMDAASNQLYVAAQTYRQGSPADAGFWPGPLDDQGNIDRDICAAWNNHAKINRTDVDNFRGTPLPATPDLLAQSIREWPGRNNPYLDRPRLNQELAPFVDVDGNGDYDPMQGDYPDIRGDQAIWWVINDVGNTKYPTTPSIGLEVDVMAFAFQTADQLNDMTFYQQKVINKSQKTLSQTWIGQWVDPDLGYFNDDFVACDVSRGLGFCYNGDNLDEGVTGYGENPPTVGVDFFEGPMADANDGIDNDRDSWLTGTFNPDSVDEPGEKIIMSNFVYYNNDFSINGNPTTAQHFYNYLRSKITTGTDLAYGGDGISGTIDARPYAFMFPSGGCIDSDPYGFGFHNPPVAGERPPYAWAESNIDGNGRSNVPADRRFLQSAGPFTLLPGAVNRITTGVIWQRAEQGGPQGSVGALCNADDKAQGLFDSDFQLPKGPPTPVLQATALDREIVLSIQPGTRVDSSGQVTTETYAEVNQTLPNAAQDRVFRFEGYLVYETKTANLAATQLNNPDQARLIARGDIINGVTQIVNYEYQQEVNSLVPVQKVAGDGGDKGIFHTLRVTTTQFSDKDARIVNFKRYYFKVVPYAYNADKSVYPSGARVVNEPFMAGNGADITVIPSKPVVINNGTVLNANVYDEVPIRRITGTGAGQNVLEISEQDETDIVRDGQKQELSYDQGKGPISVRIYDPLLVRDANFRVKFSSRLVYRTSTITGRQPAVNDIIMSTGQYVTGETGRAATPADTVNGVIIPAQTKQTARIDNGPSQQTQGRAIVRRVVSEEAVAGSATDRLITLEIEMLNDQAGGTFTAAIQRYNFAANGDSTLVAYESEPRNFEIVGGAGQGVAAEYTRHDFWKWRTEAEADWHNVVRRVSEVNEELIPEYGLSIQVKPGRTPGYQPRLNAQTSFLEATLTHAGLPWLTGVPSEAGSPAETLIGINWLLPSSLPTAGATTRTWDPNGTYSNILPISIQGLLTLRGTWAAYVNSLPIGSNGAQYTVGSDRRLNNLHNIDVVYTSNRDLWTRVPVLQIVSSNPAFALTKKGSDNKPSVGTNGQPDNSVAPDGTPSVGMGWFPGYAIDLDRGIRLNMMFAESSAPVALGGQGADKGNDLIWEPEADKFAGRNFVYVLDTKYDRGADMERRQDEAQALAGPQARGLYKSMYDQIMYVNYPRRVNGRELLSNDARVRIRVDREFTSYPDPVDPATGPNTNPEYGFSLKGQAVATNQTSTACEALSLVRVVPNPYYAFSQYEQRQLDNIVKVTNLPRRCNITIYTLSGTLVRRIRKDNTDRFYDFNLKNDNGLPLGSGVYLFHIEAPDLGCEQIVKWFGVMRPIDLDTF